MAIGSLQPLFTQGIFLDSGLPAALGKVHTYVAGTSTPQAVYTDATLVTAHPNPIILDANGRVPGGVYFDALTYKVRVTDATDVLIWELDNWQDIGQVQLAAAQAGVAKTTNFNLDNGAGSSIDDVIMRLARAVTVTAARIVYVDTATGTVAAGSAQVGTTLGGSEIVAVTNYENGAAVGAATQMIIAAGAVAANQSVFVRHIGVAATQAGQAYVEIEFS